MVTLFKSLCQEVGLIAGGPPETRKRIKSLMSSKLSNSSQSVSARKLSVENTNNMDSANPLISDLFSKRQDLLLLQGLLQKLPVDRKWTQEQRNRWLQAFTANIDLIIDIESNPS